MSTFRATMSQQLLRTIFGVNVYSLAMSIAPYNMKVLNLADFGLYFLTAVVLVTKRKVKIKASVDCDVKSL